jgi:hypothetical protein
MSKSKSATNFTQEQLDCINSLSIKQRQVLRALSNGPFHLSASERADPELYHLIRSKLARTYNGNPFDFGLWIWGLTSLGERAVKHLAGRGERTQAA